MVRIQDPVVGFAVLSSFCGQLHEALVQREVVPYRVSPSLVLAIPIVREMFRDEIVDAVESQTLVGRALDRHRDQCNVRIGWFDALHLILSVVRVHFRHGDRSGRDRGDRLGGGFVVFAHRHGFLEGESYLSFAVVSLRVTVVVAACRCGGLVFVRYSSRRCCTSCRIERVRSGNWHRADTDGVRGVWDSELFLKRGSTTMKERSSR